MKRLFYVAIIIALVAGGTIFSVLHTDAVTRQMIETLNRAYHEVDIGNYEEAQVILDEFDDIYHRNEAFFILFVRRDLVYNVHTTSASLRDYANEVTRNDFLADLMKTIEHIEVIRFNIMQIT